MEPSTTPFRFPVLHMTVGDQNAAIPMTVTRCSRQRIDVCPFAGFFGELCRGLDQCHGGVTLQLLGVHLLGRHGDANLGSNRDLLYCEQTADCAIDTAHITPPNRNHVLTRDLHNHTSLLSTWPSGEIQPNSPPDSSAPISDCLDSAADGIIVCCGKL